MAERRGQVAVKDLPPKLQKKLRRQKIMPKKARKLNRSMAGNALLFTLMFICGVFMALPLVMIINNALKPLDELYQFPPKIFVRNPNLRNFSDLFILMNDSWVPFSRYIMNTIIITVAGMVGHVIAGDLKGVHSRVLQCLELVPANLKDFPQVLLLMILFCHGAVLLSGYRSMVSTR